MTGSYAIRKDYQTLLQKRWLTWQMKETNLWVFLPSGELARSFMWRQGPPSVPADPAEFTRWLVWFDKSGAG